MRIINSFHACVQYRIVSNYIAQSLNCYTHGQKYMSSHKDSRAQMMRAQAHTTSQEVWASRAQMMKAHAHAISKEV